MLTDAPRSNHYAAQLQILRYLRGTITRSLLSPATSRLELRVYSKVDWTGDPTTNKSFTKYYIFLGDSLISSGSKKQDMVSLSSIETKHHAVYYD